VWHFCHSARNLSCFFAQICKFADESFRNVNTRTLSKSGIGIKCKSSKSFLVICLELSRTMTHANNLAEEENIYMSLLWHNHKFKLPLHQLLSTFLRAFFCGRGLVNLNLILKQVRVARYKCFIFADIVLGAVYTNDFTLRYWTGVPKLQVILRPEAANVLQYRCVSPINLLQTLWHTSYKKWNKGMSKSRKTWHVIILRHVAWLSILSGVRYSNPMVETHLTKTTWCRFPRNNFRTHILGCQCLVILVELFCGIGKFKLGLQFRN
jgi:hypothetical protein